MKLKILSKTRTYSETHGMITVAERFSFVCNCTSEELDFLSTYRNVYGIEQVSKDKNDEHKMKFYLCWEEFNKNIFLNGHDRLRRKDKDSEYNRR